MAQKIGKPKDRVTITMRKQDLKNILDNLQPNGDYSLNKTIQTLQHAYNKIK